MVFLDKMEELMEYLFNVLVFCRIIWVINREYVFWCLILFMVFLVVCFLRMMFFIFLLCCFWKCVIFIWSKLFLFVLRCFVFLFCVDIIIFFWFIFVYVNLFKRIFRWFKSDWNVLELIWIISNYKWISLVGVIV